MSFRFDGFKPANNLSDLLQRPSDLTTYLSFTFISIITAQMLALPPKVAPKAAIKPSSPPPAGALVLSRIIQGVFLIVSVGIVTCTISWHMRIFWTEFLIAFGAELLENTPLLMKLFLQFVGVFFLFLVPALVFIGIWMVYSLFKKLFGLWVEKRVSEEEAMFDEDKKLHGELEHA